MEEVLAELEQHDIWENPDKAQRLGRERSYLEGVVLQIDSLFVDISESKDLLKLAMDEFDDQTINSIKLDLDRLRKSIEKLEFRRMFSGEMDMNFFPSSTLAYAYYENFIKYVCEHLITNKGFEFKSQLYRDCRFKIMIPKTLPNDLNMAFQKIQNKIGVEKISFGSTGRVRNVHVDVKIEDGRLVLLDFPTTLTGIDHAISNLLPNDYKNQTDDYKLILDRELNKFISTLNKTLEKNFVIAGGVAANKSIRKNLNSGSKIYFSGLFLYKAK